MLIKGEIKYLEMKIFQGELSKLKRVMACNRYNKKEANSPQQNL